MTKKNVKRPYELILANPDAENSAEILGISQERVDFLNQKLIELNKKLGEREVTTLYMVAELSKDCISMNEVIWLAVGLYMAHCPLHQASEMAQVVKTPEELMLMMGSQGKFEA